MLNEHKNTFIKFLNYDNMLDFSNILTTISLRFESKKVPNFGLNLVVLYLAEKTYFNDKTINRKIYLCSIMSRNRIYSSKIFWFQLIEEKLLLMKIQPVNQLNNALTSKENSLLKQLNKLIGKEDKVDSKKKIYSINTKDLFANMKSKIKNIFKSDEVQKLEQKVKNENLGKIKKENQTKDLLRVYNEIEKFISHFANFSLDISHAIDIIVDIATKYNVPPEKISYFVTQINTSIFSVKSRNFYLYFDNNKNKLDYLLKKFDTNKWRTAILINSALFLNNNEFPTILSINKATNKQFQKLIFKKLLLENKDITMSTRKVIWKQALKIVRFIYCYILYITIGNFKEKILLSNSPRGH